MASSERRGHCLPMWWMRTHCFSGHRHNSMTVLVLHLDLYCSLHYDYRWHVKSSKFMCCTVLKMGIQNVESTCGKKVHEMSSIHKNVLELYIICTSISMISKPWMVKKKKKVCFWTKFLDYLFLLQNNGYKTL